MYIERITNDEIKEFFKQNSYEVLKISRVKDSADGKPVLNVTVNKIRELKMANVIGKYAFCIGGDSCIKYEEIFYMSEDCAILIEKNVDLRVDLSEKWRKFLSDRFVNQENYQSVDYTK